MLFFSFRLKASKILAHIAVHFQNSIQKKNLKFVKDFINLMMSLLMDDDYDIRDNTAKIVLSMPAEDLGMGKYIKLKVQVLIRNRYLKFFCFMW